MCPESDLVELIDNNCQQSSAAAFTAESPCPSLSSLSLYCFRQLQGSRLPSSSQAPLRSPFPVPCQAKRPATATPPKTREVHSVAPSLTPHRLHAPAAGRPGLLGCFVLLRLFIHCLPISLPWGTALHHEAIHCYYVLQTRVPQLCPAWLSRCICICFIV